MEAFGLRRTQSLRSISGDQERSWVMPVSTLWDRKSVSQLVQHYQSNVDLRSTEKEEHKLQPSESCVDGQWRRQDSRENVAYWRSGKSSSLSRSRSMDFLPQKESSSTMALCALFESKANLQPSFHSSPRLNSVSAAGSKTGKHHPLQDWRSHDTLLKDTNIQRTCQVQSGKALNGIPESYDRAASYAHGDKIRPPPTKGGSPSRQARATISTSSSVRDRSALYLSRAATIDSIGGSTQPQFIGASGTRTKNNKFLSPAKEMCSACLTPVYPVEKMVANKLTLHNNCFCCKHCKKKLSIHNYSSLYGEFYCISHYQQLFKRKGNYDEGFGHKQHKDRWLQKDKGRDEPDAVSTSTTTKPNLNLPDGSRELSAAEFVTKASMREPGFKKGTEVKSKLKLIWPPEKKNPGANTSHRTHGAALTNKIPGVQKAATCSVASDHRKSDRIQLNHRGEMKDKGVKEQPKPTGFNSAELPSKEAQHWNHQAIIRQVKDTVSKAVLNSSLPSIKNGLTNQKTEKKNEAPMSKPNSHPTDNRLNACPNKARKSVRFSPSVDVAKYDQSSEMTLGTTKEEFSDQSDTPEVKSMNIKDENNIFDHVTPEFNKEPNESKVNLEIPESNCHGETNTSNQETEVKVENSQVGPQAGDNVMILNEVVEKVDETLDRQSLTETFSSTHETTHQEPCSNLDMSPRSSVSSSDLGNPGSLHSSAGQMTSEEATTENSRNQFDQSADNQENSDGQNRPVARTNSLKTAAKQTEKSKAKLGSWSKGKSPLSKLFTAGGNERATKAEPKDTKKPDAKPSGLLGRLFQSSSERNVDVTKSAEQDERNDQIHAGDKKTEGKEIQEAITEEARTENITPQLSQLEEDADDHKNEELCSADLNTLGNKDISQSNEAANLPQTPASEAGNDIPVPNPPDDHESDLQSTEPDPEIPEFKDLPFAVQSENQESEGSVNQFTYKGGDGVLSDPFSDDFFGDMGSSVSTDPLAIQKTTAEYVEKPNDLLDVADDGEKSLMDGPLFDLNNESPQPPANFFGHANAKEIFGNIPSDIFSSSSETALYADTSTGSFILLDSQTISTVDEVELSLTDQLIVTDPAPLNQEGNQTLDPLGANSQTREQITDFDAFSSNDVLFIQSPPVNVSNEGGADASTTQPSTFPHGIFELSDISSSADLFADNIFASEPELMHMSKPSDGGRGESRAVSENNNSGQAAENAITDSSWMDDLLG
uniref:LIM zinc-binding domain-containing protein n=1 Tax=Mastacembelus armatus TaxID=205130 RepID=A0A3Q3MR07_9TELE